MAGGPETATRQKRRKTHTARLHKKSHQRHCKVQRAPNNTIGRPTLMGGERGGGGRGSLEARENGGDRGVRQRGREGRGGWVGGSLEERGNG